MKRILILTSARAYADGLRLGLEAHDGLTVVGSTTDPVAAVALAAELEPDFILVDTAAGDLERVAARARRLPATRIVALGLPETAESVIASAAAGAAVYVPRDASLPELVGILLIADDDHRGDATRLTPRESEILRLVDRGLSNKEIARALQIEVSTVKNHVHNILDKLHVHRRGEAAARVRGSDRI